MNFACENHDLQYNDYIISGHLIIEGNERLCKKVWWVTRDVKVKSPRGFVT